MNNKINWQKLYDSFTAEICDINCGELCAPENDGIPACCENEYHEIVLFTDELNWVAKNTDLWVKRIGKTKAEKKDESEIENYIKYAKCKGIAKCDRNYRSLTCRFFPFEPYISDDFEFLGLTFMYASGSSCPLIGNEKINFNQNYINQSISVWEKIFKAYPLEFESYTDESEKLRKLFKKNRKKIKIFYKK